MLMILYAIFQEKQKSQQDKVRYDFFSNSFMKIETKLLWVCQKIPIKVRCKW